MRKLQQEHILNSIKTISEANDEVRRLFSAGDADNALDVLADMHILSERVIEYITGIAGEGTKTEQVINEFQVVIKNYIEAAEETGEVNIGIVKLITKHLNKINSSVYNDLKPNRIEVVFIGSRPSTADSLETVYLAANSALNHCK